MIRFSSENLSSNVELLLRHITSTFGARVGMLWMADSDNFYSTLNHDKQIQKKAKTLVSFFSGYYYRYVKSLRNRVPILVEDIPCLAGIPGDLVRMAEQVGFQNLLISPITYRKEVWGTLILGGDKASSLKNFDTSLFYLLTALLMSLKLEESERPLNETSSFGFLVGKSPQMQEIYNSINRIPATDMNLFIYGEKGTGKELVARTINSHAKRPAEAFASLDCMSMSESQLESAIFGHEANDSNSHKNIKRGLFESARNGTIFLDGVTEMPGSLQKRLAQALSEKKFSRIGGSKRIDIDVRIISSCNGDPYESIQKRELDEELFYKLNSIIICVPPLRKRRDDIPLLVGHFVDEFAKLHRRTGIHISDEVIDVLMRYDFPGNVRELRSLVEKLVINVKNGSVAMNHLPSSLVEMALQNDLYFSHTNNLSYNKAKASNLMSFERRYFARLLQKFDGNISRIAREAQVSRKTIYNILNKNGLNDKSLIGKPIW